MNDLITKVKRCSRKENCIHPVQVLGGWLPETNEYFHYFKEGVHGLRANCIECQREDSRSRRRKKKTGIDKKGYYDIWKSELITGLRTCNTCNEKFPITKEYFYKNKQTKSGFSFRCKSCSAKYHQERNIKNPEKRKEIDKRWRINHPEKVNTRERNHRSKKTQNGGKHTASDIEKMIDQQKNCCYYCGENLGTSYHVDHVVPSFLGGSNNPENLVIACPKCNMSKGWKKLEQWVEKITNSDIQAKIRQRITERQKNDHRLNGVV